MVRAVDTAYCGFARIHCPAARGLRYRVASAPRGGRGKTVRCRLYTAATGGGRYYFNGLLAVDLTYSIGPRVVSSNVKLPPGLQR